MERCIVDHADYLPGGLVTKSKKVGEIILAELVVIRKQSFYAAFLFKWRFLDNGQ